MIKTQLLWTIVSTKQPSYFNYRPNKLAFFVAVLWRYRNAVAMTSSVSNIKSWDSICKRLDVVHVTDIENNTSCNTTEMSSDVGKYRKLAFATSRKSSHFVTTLHICCTVRCGWGGGGGPPSQYRKLANGNTFTTIIYTYAPDTLLHAMSVNTNFRCNSKIIMELPT